MSLQLEIVYSNEEVTIWGAMRLILGEGRCGSLEVPEGICLAWGGELSDELLDGVAPKHFH